MGRGRGLPPGLLLFSLILCACNPVPDDRLRVALARGLLVLDWLSLPATGRWICPPRRDVLPGSPESRPALEASLEGWHWGPSLAVTLCPPPSRGCAACRLLPGDHAEEPGHLLLPGAPSFHGAPFNMGSTARGKGCCELPSPWLGASAGRLLPVFPLQSVQSRRQASARRCGCFDTGTAICCRVSHIRIRARFHQLFTFI